jgi:hypothetical protein
VTTDAPGEADLAEARAPEQVEDSEGTIEFTEAVPASLLLRSDGNVTRRLDFDAEKFHCE